MAIITAHEVKVNSPAGLQWPDANINLVVDALERDYVSRLFGHEFYSTLTNDLTPLPAHIDEYNPSFEYGLDDIVQWRGVVYKSVVGCNRSEPGIDANWQRVPKFQKNCYNELWDNYLCKIP